MEYFIGSLSTFIILYFSAKLFFNNDKLIKKSNTFTYSQSHIYEIIKPLLPSVHFVKKQVKCQSRNHEESTNIKIIILENKAYWVKDNAFYVADISSNGIDKDSAEVLDIINMDKVQLDKIMFIVDRLRDGK
jgi:hypothetical protein